MLGLVVLIFFWIYFFVSIWIIKKVAHWAKVSNGKTWLWGGLAAFIMYNLVFWDWIPTLIAHKYYCSTQAGFWIYKTPEGWQKENPEMKENVSYKEQGSPNSKDYLGQEIKYGWKTSFFLNKRTHIKIEETVISNVPLISLRRREETLFDARKKFILIKKITFETGHSSGAPRDLSDFKFWINFKPCNGENGNVSHAVWLNALNKFNTLGESK